MERSEIKSDEVEYKREGALNRSFHKQKFSLVQPDAVCRDSHHPKIIPMSVTLVAQKSHLRMIPI
jgi:hypothetical protein